MAISPRGVVVTECSTRQQNRVLLFSMYKTVTVISFLSQVLYTFNDKKKLPLFLRRREMKSCAETFCGTYSNECIDFFLPLQA